ncbi:MAG: protoporphyrinogen oxidase [Ignavibacteria bacterium]|nr:protoporphyrinogen oxidase [Ignavibacteria bacterium]
MTHADTIILGAGISGLTAAYALQKQGIDVLVLEKADRAGGSIRSWRQDGRLIEAGPNSTLETTPLLTQLIRDLGIEDRKMYADDSSAKRFILRGGTLMPLPMSPGAFLRTPLFSARAKLRLFREPFIGASDPKSNETVAEFVRRRLGREFLDYAINPFVAGVYAGDPETLSVRAAFPKLFEIEQKYGGLIMGQIRGAKERKRRGEESKTSARMFSFTDGMETLTIALRDALHRVETGIRVARITTREDGGFALEAATADGPRLYTCDALVLATPAHDAAELVRELAPDLSEPLRAIPYPPVAVAITVFRPQPGMHPLDGFGFLIPAVEKREILGTIFTSTLFRDRTEAGTALLTSFVGGARQPANAELSDDDVAALVLREQTALLGTPPVPVFSAVTRWKKAIPQYTLGHPACMARVEAAEKALPGLFFCANYRGGISVGDCVKSADRSAAAVSDFLAAR